MVKYGMTMVWQLTWVTLVNNNNNKTFTHTDNHAIPTWVVSEQIVSWVGVATIHGQVEHLLPGVQGLHAHDGKYGAGQGAKVKRVLASNNKKERVQ